MLGKLLPWFILSGGLLEAFLLSPDLGLWRERSKGERDRPYRFRISHSEVGRVKLRALEPAELWADHLVDSCSQSGSPQATTSVTMQGLKK